MQVIIGSRVTGKKDRVQCLWVLESQALVNVIYTVEKILIRSDKEEEKKKP